MYNSKYYKGLYINTAANFIGLNRLYFLWLGFFCIIRPAKLNSTSKVLDVGCGIGNLVWALRKLGINAYGIEPSIAAKEYCKIKKYCTYKSLSKLKVKKPFDLIITHEVLEHISKKQLPSFLRSLSRLSKDNMIHVVCVKDRGKVAYLEKTHYTVENEKWWYRLFKNENFTVKTGHPLYFFPFLPYIFSGTLRLKGIQSGYFFIKKHQ